MDFKLARERFDQLLEQSEAAFKKRHYLQAAAYIQLAAGSAWDSHPGLFHSTRAETLLKKLSVLLISPAPTKPRRLFEEGRRQRVLHVLTEAYELGGHTRLVWRWIEADADREHHIALTQQYGTIPDQLTNSAKRSGGELYLLDRHKNLCATARALRNIGSEFDFIVLHVHPDDIVPHLAWSGDVVHPPIVFLNHADHVFWIGSQLCDVNANLRETGMALAVARRGIPAQRNILLPIPLVEGNKVPMSRQDARRELGIDDDELVAVCVASRYKFTTTNDADFVALHHPLLDHNKKLRLIVVGPSHSDEYWMHWSGVTNKRVQAVGHHLNTKPFLYAANIYIDSTPFGSLTSLLEAALAELPCVSWRPYLPGSLSAVLSCDDVAFNEFSIAFTDRDQYLRHVEGLLESPEKACKIGKDLCDSVIKKHASKNWNAQLDLVYQSASINAKGRPHAAQAANIGDAEEYDRVLSEFQKGDAPSLAPVLRSLPISVRFRYLGITSSSKIQLVRALVQLVKALMRRKTIWALKALRSASGMTHSKDSRKQ